MRNAKAKGKPIGRPQTMLDDIPANFLRHYPQYKKGAFNLTELARLCGISRTTVKQKTIVFLAKRSKMYKNDGETTDISPSQF